MKYTGIFFCVLLFCCKSREDKKILEEFKKVNESIDEKNRVEQSLDSTLSMVGLINSQKNWRTQYFSNTPTVGAHTILTKIYDDINNGATLAMAAMADQLQK